LLAGLPPEDVEVGRERAVAEVLAVRVLEFVIIDVKSVVPSV